MLPKVAIVLFVKDEFPGICDWLAWYFSIGVDTIIVHDDHSTDGTWEAVVAASRCLDVRPFRTDLTIQPHTARQRYIYLGAAKQFRDEFDWIGFVDADEYLYLCEHIDLPSFLARFPDAGGIAFSWCIYGSNDHLLKPAASTVEAFTRHSLPAFGHNRSVKSFVRPGLVVDQWRDPHTFEIGGAPYLDPRGQPVAWGGPGGISHDPDWSVAKLMHFIPRSMEHFIERIRRRADLRGHTNGYWNVFNMNDVEDRRPLKILPATRPFLAMIDREIMTDYAARLATTAPDAEDGADRRHVATVSLVRSWFGTILALDRDNRLVHLDEADLSAPGYSRVFAVSGSCLPGTAMLFAPDQPGLLGIPNDPRLSGIMAFITEAASEAGKIQLRNPRTRRYLTALPPAAPATGNICGDTSGDRGEANAWETFELLPLEAAGDIGAGLEFLSGLVETIPGAGIIIAMAKAGADPMICAAGIQLLPAAQRMQLDRTLPPVLPSWV